MFEDFLEPLLYTVEDGIPDLYPKRRPVAPKRKHARTFHRTSTKGIEKEEVLQSKQELLNQQLQQKELMLQILVNTKEEDVSDEFECLQTRIITTTDEINDIRNDLVSKCAPRISLHSSLKSVET